MSYDFRLCLPQPGRSREEIARADAEEIDATDPVPEKEQRKQRVSAALRAKNPALKPFAFVFEEIARFEKTTVEEAKRKHRHIELNYPDGTKGIQIMLFDDVASVTVPYWHQGDGARLVFEEIWTCLKIIESEGGFFTYDPQIDRVVDLKTDFGASLSCYSRVSRDVATRLPEAVARRWWEFWRKR